MRYDRVVTFGDLRSKGAFWRSNHWPDFAFTTHLSKPQKLEWYGSYALDSQALLIAVKTTYFDPS